jgi:5-methylcytosine-specific restriction endonuclease McrA
MPIRPDLKHYYGAQWRTQIRPRILERDGHRCKFCGKPDRTAVRQVIENGSMWWSLFQETTWTDQTGEKSSADASKFRDIKTVRVVLTVAHLNHNPADNRTENLAALCQWCHLNYDKEHHANTRAMRKDQARPLLMAAMDEKPTASARTVF